MKRRREEMEKGRSEIRSAMEELSELFLVKPEEKASTLALLTVSKQLLHVLDKIGPILLVLRQDIQQNVERVEELHARDPSVYSSLTAILTKEKCEGTTKKSDSCSRAVVWLIRSINFTVAFLERLVKDPELNLAEAVEEAYKSTLKPWHGWIASAAYKQVALKLIPEKDIFISLLMGKGQDFEDLAGDIKNLLTMLQPLVDETNAILRKNTVDKLKSP
ncbi:glycolipid transfer protein 3-like isoform X1 [Typha angustifolia]|uniref:glycolipid transfer protein 3-like isoform X1 n=1 Tax=Typha angustifolia TaxID=59011 RepID=UPI003C2E898D